MICRWRIQQPYSMWRGSIQMWRGEVKVERKRETRTWHKARHLSPIKSRLETRRLEARKQKRQCFGRGSPYLL